MARTWQVRLAAALVALSTLFGVALIAAAFRLMHSDPGFLFAIMPILWLLLAGGGTFIAGCSLTLTIRLLARARAVRFQTAVLGAVEAFAAFYFVTVSPLAALVLVAHGGALVALMASSAAGRELGGWVAGMGPVAPWGQEPGTGPWQAAAPAQGPWAPDPTTLPWLPWTRTAGPQTPWWEVWKVGLARGIPLGDMLVLAVAGPVFVLSLVALTVTSWRGISLLPMVLSMAAVWWVERRLRERVAGRR